MPLRKKGWDQNEVTLVVAEGISYYVPKGPFRETLLALKNPGGGLVFEYTIPDDDITPNQIDPLYSITLTSLDRNSIGPAPSDAIG